MARHGSGNLLEQQAPPESPLWKMWKILRPAWSDILSGRELEVVSAVLVALCRALEIRLKTQVVRILDGTLTSRDAAQFKAALVRITLITMFGSTLSLTYQYIQARISWKWRQKLLRLLHDEYFDNMRYYQISEGGAYGADRMTDADSRLTDSMNATVNGFAHAFNNTVYTAIAGMFSTVEIARLFGWRMAAVPYAYGTFSPPADNSHFQCTCSSSAGPEGIADLCEPICCCSVIGTFIVVEIIAPVSKTWRMLGRERGRTWGIYCNQQMKLIEKAESIAALKGAVHEAKLFCEQSTAVRVACYNEHIAFWKFGIVNNFFQWFMMDQLAPIFIIGRAIMVNKRKGAGTETIEQMADVRAEAGLQWVLFTQTIMAARVMMNTVRVLQRMVGDVERVTELLDLLAKVKKDKQHQRASHVKTGDSIAFSGVEIVTPAGVDLVHNLTFEVTAGESLLLVGHNGAGKSSIFRCLGSLWDVSRGTITKPPMEMLFYIPQKPYNVLGTLQDQLYYPKTVHLDVSAELSRDALYKILSQVDLTHLLERAGALTDEINWEDELSLGEKQRLAIARLLHHKPRFAILDECSSAISDEMTRRLYRICKAQKTAYITIAHRPVLKAYHDRLLSIGDGKQGFTLEAIPESEKLAAQAAITTSATALDGADALLRAQLKARSAQYAGEDTANREGQGLPQRSMLARGWRVIKLGWIDYTLLRLASSFAGVFLQVWMQNYQMLNVGHMFGCLMTGDMGRMLQLSRNSLLLCFLQPVVYESVLFIQREIGHDMMERAQDYLMERLLKHGNYYKIAAIDGRIKDTKQRVCGDCHEVFHHFDSLVVNGLVSFLKLLFYTYRIGVFLNWKYPAALWAYFAVSTGTLRAVMPNFRLFHSKMSVLDHKFKLVHARLKMCAESVAFFDGGARERRIAERKFDDYMAQQWKLDLVNFRFRVIQDVFQSRIPEGANWAMRFAYGVIAGGTDAELLADRGVKVNLGQAYLASMCGEVFASLGAMIGLVENCAQMTGKLARVSEMLEVLDELDDKHAQPSGSVADNAWSWSGSEMSTVGSGLNVLGAYGDAKKEPHQTAFTGEVPGSLRTLGGWLGSQAAPDAVAARKCGARFGTPCYVTAGKWWHRLEQQTTPPPQQHQLQGHSAAADAGSGGASIRLEGVDLVTPRGDAVCTNLTCQINQGASLMLTGSNATGKTSLVRTIAGLWPVRKGSLTLDFPDDFVEAGTGLSSSSGNGSMRRQQLFVLPQRIFMTLGSLSDQVTYPDSISKQARTPEIEQRLQKLLDLVGIGYLVSRWAGDADHVDYAGEHKGWDHVATWEDVLSLGEQQRLSMARVFYHRPVFACLDECTSAVSIDQESRLFTSAKQLGITLISISQRLSLPEHHEQELQFGQANQDGYILEAISHDDA